MPTNRVRNEFYHTTFNLLAYKDVKANDLTVTLETVYSWEAGQGREAFLAKLEDYNYEYSMKMINMESTYHVIKRAEKNVRNLINAELSKGPKF